MRWSGALRQRSVDVVLLPLYTPIRVDSEDYSMQRVVMGGIHLYLRQHWNWYRRLPRSWTRWLDHPRVIRWLAGNRVKTDASELGELTLSMLRGDAGLFRDEFTELVDWIQRDLEPDLIIFSNLFLAGAAPRLSQETDLPMLAVLQGDDVFLDQLTDSFRDQALHELRRLVSRFSGFLVHSREYGQRLSQLLEIPADQLHPIPLGLEVAPFHQQASRATVPTGERPPTIGYLARIAPEKGLHLVCQAFVQLKRRAKTGNCRLRIAGWGTRSSRRYLQESLRPIEEAGYRRDVDVVGEVSLEEKQQFLQSIDVLSVPCTRPDPKGLFVLEALAAGVPFVQPDHGSFPELLESTAGGLLFRAGDVADLADPGGVTRDPERRNELGQLGRERHTEPNFDLHHRGRNTPGPRDALRRSRLRSERSRSTGVRHRHSRHLRVSAISACQSRAKCLSRTVPNRNASIVEAAYSSTNSTAHVSISSLNSCGSASCNSSNWLR